MNSNHTEKVMESKRKSKKLRKEKKVKKHKSKNKKKRMSSSVSDSESSEMEWVEVTAEIKKVEVQREDWMCQETFVPTLSKEEMLANDSGYRRKPSKDQNRDVYKPGQHARELNPYWKDGGKGVPEDSSLEIKLASSLVNDGGLSHLKKAYQRIEEQAEEEDKTMEEIAVERWGSLDRLKALIAEAEERMRMKTHYRDRHDHYQDRHGRKRDCSNERKRDHSDEWKRDHLDERKRDHLDKRKRDHLDKRKKDHSDERKGDHSDERKRDHLDERKRDHSDERKRDHSDERKRDHSCEQNRDHSREQKRDHSHERKRDYSHERKRDYGHSKHERSAETRHEQRHYKETTYDKNMFKKPSQESAEENKKTWHSGQSSHEPAWKKKKPTTESLASNENGKESAYDGNMFKRPSQDSMEEKQESSHSRQSSQQPAWMKKKPSQKPLAPDKNTTDESQTIDSFNFKKNSHTEDTPTNASSEESVFMTDNEMNNLAAKILKAEMRGDGELAKQLQSKLDAARNARKSGLSSTSSAEQKRGEEVILSKVDSHGIARPLVSSDYPASSSKKKGHHNKMSKVKSYFSDESEHSLKKMFEREKLTTTDDQIEMFVDAALESRGLTDQDYEIGDIPSKVAKKMGQQRQDERDYNKAIQEHKRLNTALEKCEYCFEKMKKHLIISDSPQAYLCLPSYQSLTEDHCLIVPKAHVSSSLLLDEDVVEEIKNFKQILVNMFQEQKKCVAFVETSINLKYSPHLVIECFPMPMDVGDSAPMYFKKAIQDHGSEWANNKKLIDLFKKDLKHSVPKGLPFFAVEFSRGGGYAHVVEDRDFPRHFGKEIIGGMLEIDSHLCTRYRKEDFKEQAKKVLQFSNIWKSYTNKSNIVM